MAKLHMETRSALRIFGICGLASVLVDIDHAYALVLGATIYPSLTEGRLFHPAIILVVCCVGLVVCASVGRLYVERVLRRRSERTYRASATEDTGRS